MKFIEISDGLSIRKDRIVSVKRDVDGSSIIKTDEGSYETNFSYSTILSLLEMEKIEEKVSSVGPDTVNLWGAQHWRG